MNAASATASDSLVNLATGAIIDPTNAAGVLVQSHSPETASANKAFDYMSGTDVWVHDQRRTWSRREYTSYT
jgi:hypothetical protein